MPQYIMTSSAGPMAPMPQQYAQQAQQQYVQQQQQQQQQYSQGAPDGYLMDQCTPVPAPCRTLGAISQRELTQADAGECVVCAQALSVAWTAGVPLSRFPVMS
jgi:hypothetical protein